MKRTIMVNWKRLQSKIDQSFLVLDYWLTQAPCVTTELIGDAPQREGTFENLKAAVWREAVLGQSVHC